MKTCVYTTQIGSNFSISTKFRHWYEMELFIKYFVCFQVDDPEWLLWFCKNTWKKYQFLGIFELKEHQNWIFFWLFQFCSRSAACLSHSFNYEPVLCLAFLRFCYLPTPVCSSTSPSSSHANTRLFGSPHLCNSDCSSSHGNHRETFIRTVSIHFSLVHKVYSLHTIILCAE